MFAESASETRKLPTRSRIYRHIYNARDFCTKQSLSTELGLSLPTIYQHLSELMADGLVDYSGERRATGGRRANGLAVVPDARFAIGVSVTENRLRITSADLCLHEIAYRSMRTPMRPDAPEYGPYLARTIEDFLDGEELDRARLLGVGIAFPAVLSPDGHKALMAPTLEMRDVSLDHLTAGLPYPAFIRNDGSCGGFAEWLLRRSHGNMAYLSLENGVGGAVMTGGTNYLGDNLRSGEFGHMRVERDGLSCKCGKRGCLEAYCSARRISDDLNITLEEFFTGVERHVPEYEAIWQDLLQHLALGVNNVRMALDCEVVLGGFLSEYLAPYFPQLKAYAAQANTFEQDAEYLHLSVLRRHTAPLGAAFYFIQEFLDSI